jgi:hypothetical protein
MSEFDFVNFNSRLIDFLETYEELIFFRDDESGGKGVSCKWFVLFFNERYEDDLIEVRCDQVLILFFTETEEGKRLKRLIQSKAFDVEQDAFLANKSVLMRIFERI